MWSPVQGASAAHLMEGEKEDAEHWERDWAHHMDMRTSPNTLTGIDPKAVSIQKTLRKNTSFSQWSLNTGNCNIGKEKP